ncbi:hypothetical protein H0H87_010198 [Tephrocybe sp. NHM501043]|nr:hypothetical protein H0H87_010198 [Tephrocybe sp. NHM501043]
MPSYDSFAPSVLKRSCPIKALLLDQSFNAGVGNWVADEILYNARIHPEQRCNTLSTEQLAALHHQTSEGKGKKEHTLLLPSGEPATIKWITVGGRTSAYVQELQVPPMISSSTPKKCVVKKRKVKGKHKAISEEEESDLTVLSDSAEEGTSPMKKIKPHELQSDSSNALIGRDSWDVEEGKSKYFTREES